MYVVHHVNEPITLSVPLLFANTTLQLRQTSGAARRRHKNVNFYKDPLVSLNGSIEGWPILTLFLLPRFKRVKAVSRFKPSGFSHTPSFSVDICFGGW